MEMMNRITVTCFAASYAVALLFELLRLGWPNRPNRWFATTFAAAGLLAETLFLFAISWQSQKLPIESQFDSLITVSWALCLVYFYLLLRDRRLGAGLFLLPIAVGLILFSANWSDRNPSPSGKPDSTIAIAHGVLLLLGTVAVSLAAVSAIMYLVKIYQLRHGTLSRLRLPSLEKLDRFNTVAITLAWPLMTVGIALGMLLGSLRYSDPKMITTLGAWLAFTVLVHHRFQLENRGKRIALMTIVACALVMLSVLGDPIFGTAHQMSRGAVP